MIVTIGVDFAASPRNTAACEIRWHQDGATITKVLTPVDDATFLALLAGLPAGGRLGLDCPLGWPDGFVTAVAAHHRRQPWPSRGTPDRAELVWRATDRWVREHCGRWPLSVSTDRIGVTALRAAYLLDAWEAKGGSVDRSGMTGPVVEVYPAAARRLWNLAPVRDVAEITAGVPLDFAEPALRQTIQASEHAFDAVVAALVARAAALGRTHAPPPALQAVAAAEGWIHLPDGPLEELV